MTSCNASDVKPGMILCSTRYRFYLVVNVSPNDDEGLINLYTVITQEQKLKTMRLGVNSKVNVL